MAVLQETMDSIKILHDYIRENGPQTIRALADKLGKAPTTVQRYKELGYLKEVTDSGISGIYGITFPKDEEELAPARMDNSTTNSGYVALKDNEQLEAIISLLATLVQQGELNSNNPVETNNPVEKQKQSRYSWLDEIYTKTAKLLKLAGKTWQGVNGYVDKNIRIEDKAWDDVQKEEHLIIVLNLIYRIKKDIKEYEKYLDNALAS